MKHVIGNGVVLSHTPVGPLAPHIGPFVRFASKQGYVLSSVRYQARLIASFSAWLERNGVDLKRITSDHPKRYLQYRLRRRRPTRSDVAALRQCIGFLREEGVVPAEKVQVIQLTPVERCTQAYEQHLRKARALSEATIRNYAPFVRRFLTDRFGAKQVVLSQLCARDVVRFVQRQAQHLHNKRAKLMTSALRSFFAYARYRGELVADLATAIPVVPNWSMSSMPRAISADQVHQLLASIDRRTPGGRRDYAIVLLLARLGLRSSEVVSLELGDVDWNTGTLHVRGKGGRHNELPLPEEVGEAIADYLCCGRPPSASRRLFLRARAPAVGFRGPVAIASLVCHSLQRAGIAAPTSGAHQFRHGLATEMLRQGASLEEIGDLLGHRHPQTTMIYARVDLDALRTLALPWPGGVR